MIRWLIVALFFLFPVFSYAQGCTCTLKGEVREIQSGKPVAGVIILLKEANRTTVTSAQGHYELSNLCQGSYTLISKLIGYQSDTLRITLQHTEEEHDLHLAEEDIHLQNVTVTAQKLASSTLPRGIIDGDALTQTRGQTLADALQSVTGVTAIQTGSSIGKPVIRGLHSNRVLILNNGVRQEGQQWGSEHAPEIDPFVANRLTVVKGAAGVRYGPEAIGGVVLVDPEPVPTDPTLHGSVHLAGFSNGRQGASSAQFQGGIKALPGFGWRIQGTLKRGGNIRTPHYFLDNTGTAEQNFSVMAAYRRGAWHTEFFMSRFHTKLGIFSGSHIGSLTDLENVLKNGEPFVKSGFSYAINRPYQDVGHTLQKLKISYVSEKTGIWTLTASRQQNNRAEYDLHRPRNDSLAALNRPELNFELSTYSGDLNWEHRPIAKRLTGSAGITFQYQRNLVYGRPLIPNFRQSTASAYWLEKLTANSWEFEAGVRYDYRHQRITTFPRRGVIVYEYLNFGNISGSLGAVKRWNSVVTTRLNGGMAWRPPNVNELFSAGVHHGSAAYEEGDATLQPETAYNLDLTTQITHKRLTAEVSLYRNYIQNFIYLKPHSEPILTIRGAFPYFKYTQVDAVFQGIDFSFNYQITNKLSLESKYSLVRATDVRNHARLVQIPPDRITNRLRWQSSKTFFLQAGHTYVARQSRAPENGDFAAPPAAYGLWDASAGTSFPKQMLEISVGITNAFDTAYRDYLNRFRYYSDDQGRNVAIRAKWSF